MTSFDEFAQELLTKHIVGKCICEKSTSFTNSCDKIRTYKNYCSKERILYNCWVVGGMSGGNCYGNYPDNPKDAEDECQFVQFEMIFKEYYPNVGYFDMINFIEKYSKITEESETEYYGNYTNYKIRAIKLIDVYNFLVSKGMLK